MSKSPSKHESGHNESSEEVSVEDFKKHIIESDVLDPEGVHHEFVSGLHGRKLDFDVIPDDSELFREWVQVVAQKVAELYPDIPLRRLALLSVAGGTNRLVGPVAEAMGGGVTSLLTEKISPKEVELTTEAKKNLKELRPELVLVIEDVGTQGTTSASAVRSATEAGARRVEALNTWQRSHSLIKLDEIGANYNSVVKELLPNLTPEECRESGYCAQGWKLIEHA